MFGRLALVTLGLAAVLGCESPLDVGASCARDSACASPYVCRLGRCRSACSEGRDCPAGQVCLEPSPGVGACELPAIDVCSLSCDAPLVCVSGRCRQECAAATDCPRGHQCAAGACERAPEADAGPPTDAAEISDARADAGSDAGWECDPVAGTGCSGVDRCVLVGATPTCVGGLTGAALYAPCAADDACAPGLSCQGGRCVRVCYEGHDADCGEDLACSLDAVADQTSLPPGNGFGLCTEPCDPVAGTGCPPETSCSVGIGPLGRAYTWCRVIGPRGAGQVCTYSPECATGLECHGTPSTCRPSCHTMADCTSGGPCDSWADFTVRADVGICGL